MELIDSDHMKGGDNEKGEKNGYGENGEKDSNVNKILEGVKVVGGNRAKKKLIDMLDKARMYGDRYKSMNIRADIGVLLYGLPGVGKSELAKQVARRYSEVYSGVKIMDIAPESYLGKRTKSIEVLRKHFNDAKKEIIEKNVTYVILIDEIDSLCPKRGKKSTGIIASERTDAILKMIDVIRDDPMLVGRLFIIGTTNLINRVDHAIFRAGRFKRVSILLPNYKERVQLTEMYLGGLVIEIGEIVYSILDMINIKEVADLTEGFSGADFMVLRKEIFDTMLDNEELGIGITIDDILGVIKEHALDSTNAALMEIARFEAAMVALEEGEGIGMGLMEPD